MLCMHHIPDELMASIQTATRCTATADFCPPVRPVSELSQRSPFSVCRLLVRWLLLFHVATGTMNSNMQITEGEENADWNSRPMAGLYNNLHLASQTSNIAQLVSPVSSVQRGRLWFWHRVSPAGSAAHWHPGQAHRGPANTVEGELATPWGPAGGQWIRSLCARPAGCCASVVYR